MCHGDSFASQKLSRLGCFKPGDNAWGPEGIPYWCPNEILVINFDTPKAIFFRRLQRRYGVLGSQN